MLRIRQARRSCGLGQGGAKGTAGGVPLQRRQIARIGLHCFFGLAHGMMGGQNATFIIFASPEEGIGIPVDLNGFKDGYTALP